MLYSFGSPSRLWSLQVPGGKPQPLFEASSGNLSDAQISPDGKWVAYTSDESGKNQIYARQFPDGGGKAAISINGGEEPRWSRDGRELFYRDAAKNELMAVDMQTAPAFRAGQPKALFTLASPYWDAAPDGKRFLVVRPSEAAGGPATVKMQVVVNWFDELRQKVPAGKK